MGEKLATTDIPIGLNNQSEFGARNGWLLSSSSHDWTASGVQSVKNSGRRQTVGKWVIPGAVEREQ